MAFTKKKTLLKNIILNGKVLPWVTSAKHLGCKITDNTNGLSKDIMEKRAQYINRANELDQEFYFAHTSTRVLINNIFNTSFCGSQVWNLFNCEAVRVEKTLNVSQRNILRLPRNCSGTRHIRFVLLKSFLDFVTMIASSTKRVLGSMLSVVKNDCRSTTGNNLRKIMLMLNKNNLDPIAKYDLSNLLYAKVPPDDEWKVTLAKEIIDVRDKPTVLPGVSINELNHILESITTQHFHFLFLIFVIKLYYYYYYYYFIYFKHIIMVYRVDEKKGKSGATGTTDDFIKFFWSKFVDFQFAVFCFQNFLD